MPGCRRNVSRAEASADRAVGAIENAPLSFNLPLLDEAAACDTTLSREWLQNGRVRGLDLNYPPGAQRAPVAAPPVSAPQVAAQDSLQWKTDKTPERYAAAMGVAYSPAMANGPVMEVAKMLATEKPEAALARAVAVLDDARTTDPVARRGLAPIAAIAGVCAAPPVEWMARLTELYDNAVTDRETFVCALPGALAHSSAEQRIDLIAAFEARAAADGLTVGKRSAHGLDDSSWRPARLGQRDPRAQARRPAARPQPQRGLANRDLHERYIPFKREMLREGTPEQIERLAGVDEAWAALLERARGEHAQAHVAATKFRAEARELRRLAKVKRAAQAAAMQLAQ